MSDRTIVGGQVNTAASSACQLTLDINGTVRIYVDIAVIVTDKADFDGVISFYAGNVLLRSTGMTSPGITLPLKPAKEAAAPAFRLAGTGFGVL